MIHARRLVVGRTPVRCWQTRPIPGKSCRGRCQRREVGEVFVECAGKTGLPGLGLVRQDDNCVSRGEDGCRRKKPQLVGSKEGGWVYTGPKPGAKTALPVEVLADNVDAVIDGNSG
jgi:hypothetical protein